jgi:hypothetical protein
MPSPQPRRLGQCGAAHLSIDLAWESRRQITVTQEERHPRATDADAALAARHQGAGTRVKVTGRDLRLWSWKDDSRCPHAHLRSAFCESSQGGRG